MFIDLTIQGATEALSEVGNIHNITAAILQICELNNSDNKQEFSVLNPHVTAH